MALFTTTRHRSPGRFLQHKVWLFSIAAVVLLVGMARGIDLLVGIAVALLAVAFVLRFFEKDDEEEVEEDDDFGDLDDPAADEPPSDAALEKQPID